VRPEHSLNASNVPPMELPKLSLTVGVEAAAPLLARRRGYGRTVHSRFRRGGIEPSREHRPVRPRNLQMRSSRTKHAPTSTVARRFERFALLGVVGTEFARCRSTTRRGSAGRTPARAIHPRRASHAPRLRSLPIRPRPRRLRGLRRRRLPTAAHPALPQRLRRGPRRRPRSLRPGRPEPACDS
jgi:hypothetical protein